MEDRTRLKWMFVFARKVIFFSSVRYCKMGLKETGLWFVLGAGLALGLPTLLKWGNVMWTPPYTVGFDWSKTTIPFIGGTMPAMAMEAEQIAYAGRVSPSGGGARTITIMPRGGGRSIPGHTGNTIGYGGDLNAAPFGWQWKLLNPVWSGTYQRYVRS